MTATAGRRKTTVDASDVPSAIAPFVRRFKKGYTLERTGGGHYRVRNPKGELVQYQGKNITLTGTGRSDAIVRMETALKSARVLRPETKSTRRRPTDAQEKARKERLAEAVRVRQVGRQKVADELYEKLSDKLDLVGGVHLPGIKADLGYIGSLIARQMHVESENGAKPITPDLATQSAIRVLDRNWVETRYQDIWNELARRLDENTVDTWFTLVREARGLPSEVIEVRKPVEGDWPFRVELLPMEALVVDHGYQRPVPWPFVRERAAKFDESLVGTIDVSERRHGAVFAILDGQLRFETCKLVGKSTIWCSVYSGLDITDEARFFLHKNHDRKAIHPFYTFRARVTAGETDAVKTDEIVKKHGYQLAIAGPKDDRPDNISAISAVQAAYRRKRPDGTNALDPTLATLRKATYGMVQGQNNVLIRGLAYVYSNFHADEVDDERMRETLVNTPPDLMLARARETARHSGGNAEYALARVLITEYNRGRGVKKLRTV